MNPSNDPRDPGDDDPLSPEERQALELRWYQGRMFRFVSSLLAFVERRRDEILLVAGGSLEQPALIPRPSPCSERMARSIFAAR